MNQSEASVMAASAWRLVTKSLVRQAAMKSQGRAAAIAETTEHYYMYTARPGAPRDAGVGHSQDTVQNDSHASGKARYLAAKVASGTRLSDSYHKL